MGHYPPAVRLFSAVVLLTVLVVSGCGSGRLVVPITIDRTVLAATIDGGALADEEQTVRGVAGIFVHDLALPVPDRLTVYVYGSREGFERGLITDGRVSPARAAELSEFAIGVGRRRLLLLNEEGADRHSREWLRLIAHELTHVSQIELARGEGRAAQWLAEGMAEWVAFTVLERLGLDAVPRRRAVALQGIQSYAALAAARLDLETLGSPRGFTVRHRRDGSLPTYQLAFLMTDYLIQRNGFDRVVHYFQSFADSQDRDQNFEAAFGQTTEEFEAEIVAHLKSIVP